MLDRFLHDPVFHLVGVKVLFGNLERNESFRDRFIFQFLVFRIEIVDTALGLKWIKQVLGNRNKLIRLFINQSKKFEEFHMEWEVFNALRQLNRAHDQLDDRVDQQHQLLLMLTKSENPQLHAVVKLPTVYAFHCISGEIVPCVSQVQTELSNVQKPKLVGLCEVQTKHFNETVLGSAKSVLNCMASATDLRLLGKFKVHLFDRVLEKCAVIGLCEVLDHMEQCVKN